MIEVLSTLVDDWDGILVHDLSKRSTDCFGVHA